MKMDRTMESDDLAQAVPASAGHACSDGDAAPDMVADMVEADALAEPSEPIHSEPIHSEPIHSEPIHSVSGTIKWFDATRGFGFLVDEGGAGDVLIHFSVLRDHGRRTLPEGTRVACTAIRRARGLQARTVVSIDLTTATGPDADTVARSSADRVDPAALVDDAGPFEAVTVKWFNRLKGYGFVTRPGDTQDIFVHMETVRRAGLGELMPDQVLMARIAAGRKGPLAVAVSTED